MQKLILSQSQQQRLSPQQIQFIKLLQIPTVELAQRIEEELEINPALEEGKDLEIITKDKYSGSDDDGYDDRDNSFESVESYSLDELNIKDYRDADEYGGYKMSDNYNDEVKEIIPVISVESLQESLLQQLGFLRLNERETIIGKQLIGSIEDDGYLRRPLKAICNDLAFGQNIYTNEAEVEKVLSKVQKFEPAGIGARDLQECLILQIEKKDDSSVDSDLALTILEDYFDEFSKKHFDKIQKKLAIDDDRLKSVFQLITRLNPKPGNMISEGNNVAYLMADFIVTTVNGKIEIILNSKNAPDLRVSKSFSEMLDTYSKVDKQNKQIKETVTFVKQKLDAAKWFIDAIKQRQQTLLRTMEAIVEFQISFFQEGDESKLRPMILKDIAEKIDMDISTVSRVANSKSVQTDFGIYPLKYFFSEGISTESGEDASSREVKNILKSLIEDESKSSPHSDDKLEKLLKAKGYNIARRTVAKYREQLGIPVARLRKEI
jgi:RNA polymerase sigma-54 factor